METFRSTRKSIRGSGRLGRTGTSSVVLVVEDSAELRLVLKEALESEGYRVLATRDDAEALEILRGTRADLLIWDLADPPQSKEALDALRQEFPELPVIALSPAGHDPTLLFAAWRAPRRYRTLSKPFRLGELLAVSREVLGAASSAQPGR